MFTNFIYYICYNQIYLFTNFIYYICYDKIYLFTYLYITHVMIKSIGFTIIYQFLAGIILKYHLYNEFFSELTVQLKIIIATFQIISSSSNALLVNYPQYFEGFTNIVEVLLRHCFYYYEHHYHHHHSFITTIISSSSIAIIITIITFTMIIIMIIITIIISCN